MSIQYIRYVCSNCGKNTKENNSLDAIKCALCNKVVCHHCAPKGFCETCLAHLPPQGKKMLNKAYAKKKTFTIMIWIYILLLFISTPMIIITGGTDFQANNPNADTLQKIFLIIAGVSFVGACPVGVISSKMTKKMAHILADVAILAKKHSRQTGAAIPNVGILQDDQLFTFSSQIGRLLGYGPKKGIEESLQTIVHQNITPARGDFLHQVFTIVAKRFKKANEHGRALMSFMIVTSLMELYSRVESQPFSTLGKLPENVRDFLIAVTKMSNATKIAQKIKLG